MRIDFYLRIHGLYYVVFSSKINSNVPIFGKTSQMNILENRTNKAGLVEFFLGEKVFKKNVITIFIQTLSELQSLFHNLDILE